MHQLLKELKPNYAQCKEYQVLERVFGEHYRLEKSEVIPKAQKELGADSLHLHMTGNLRFERGERVEARLCSKSG